MPTCAEGGSIRAFYALSLAPDARLAVGRLRDRLRGHRLLASPVRPTPDASLHLTLKFLGDLELTALPRFEALVDEAIPTRMLQASVEGWVAFPSPKSAKVIGVRLGESSGKLVSLARSLESRAADLGIAEERREFLPHLTLGRLSNPCDVRQLLAAMPNENVVVEFDALVLYQSVLTSRGATYTALVARPLKDGGSRPG
ncbi:MAG: RNA 2',3'-cyclic phosphodiesterase [Polyangiaceae bacterium]